MTQRQDPHRVLGLVPGASPGEIRAAYRRLAKLYHPDAAGERALPRFLAIQAAYEQLVDGEGRLRTGGPAGRGRAADGDAWRANPVRSRASRDAWRAQRASGGSGGSGATPRGGAAGRGATGRAGGPRGTGPSARGGGAEPSQGDGSPGGTSDRGAGGDAAGARRGAASNRGASGGAAGSRPGPAPGGRRRDAGDPRHRRTARPGSTTYDEATLPLDPDWDGGAWYGPTSGTYWTLNPREYADPRKHGPEYQARARRASRVAGSSPAHRAGTTSASEPPSGPPTQNAADARDDEAVPPAGPAAQGTAADDPGAGGPPRARRS